MLFIRLFFGDIALLSSENINKKGDIFVDKNQRKKEDILVEKEINGKMFDILRRDTKTHTVCS